MTATHPILVVDDDPQILQVVTDILSDEGYVVQSAKNGQEALQALERIDPMMVLLDMRMPFVNGWDFMHALGNQRSFPVLVMTAAQDARQWAADVKADGYLEKPFDLNDLLSSVQGLSRQSPPPSAG